jgi:hypothetical protein
MSIALTPPDLGLPPEVLAAFGLCFESPVHVSADLGGIAGGPGPVDQGASGLGVPRCGHGPLSTALGAGVFCGHQAQACHQVSWALEPRQLANCGHHGHGAGARHAAPGLQGCDDRRQAPRCDLVLACWVETLEACGVFMQGTDGCLRDDGRRRGRTDDCREPAPVGRTPGGPARGAEIVAEHEGVAPERGGLQIAEGVFTCPGEITTRCSCHLRDIDHGESTRAGQAGQLHGGSAVGCDPIAWFLGDQRGYDHPAVVACLRQIAVEPGAPGAGCVNEEQMCGLGWQRAEEVVNVTVAGADGTEGGDLSAVLWRDVSYGNRVCVDVHAEVKRARLAQG